MGFWTLFIGELTQGLNGSVASNLFHAPEEYQVPKLINLWGGKRRSHVSRVTDTPLFSASSGSGSLAACLVPPMGSIEFAHGVPSYLRVGYAANYERSCSPYLTLMS